ncbi:MAG: glycoside hydrolase family 116 protein, partial [Saprospiraceae bacterium]|nr:glycoside hydrolase family 116 protein [Saprospiraceae bacterium]
AWEVVNNVVPRLPTLEKKTIQFVNAFLSSNIPDVVKEAALFNLAHLRTQLVFRIKEGLMFGWEGNFEQEGACFGSCTHVWNYEQTTAFLFSELAKTMRDVEFGYATDEQGLMSFRVFLPLDSAQLWGKAAADGQMGSIMQFYREWQLSGDDEMLERLWPDVKRALEFCWIPGGWDADMDGVMEGAQHNTMDVEYYGPNPQMGFWYLGALKAAEKMSFYIGEKEFTQKCKRLFDQGSNWIDEHLFNGEYYEHEIRPPVTEENIAPSLLVGMGAKDFTKPDYQLGNGVLVDQLIGQLMAHFCGLGYLANEEHIKATLKAIMKYNYRETLNQHTNVMRSYALADESALLMAAYPHGRPETPFPYFSEVMTGFEYTAAIGMLYEGQIENGLQCIKNIRDRYDGRKRNPFNEAEYGNHYARSMIAWGGILAMTGFEYSAVDHSMRFNPTHGTYFWSNGYQYGTVEISDSDNGKKVKVISLYGKLALNSFILNDFGKLRFKDSKIIEEGEYFEFYINKNDW